MNAFWASENFEAFIALRSSPAKESPRKTLARNDPVFRAQSRWLCDDMLPFEITQSVWLHLE